MINDFGEFIGESRSHSDVEKVKNADVEEMSRSFKASSMDPMRRS